MDLCDTALRDAVTQYAKTSGKYDSNLAALRKIYEGKKGYDTNFDAKVEQELVADLIGDYVFSDGDFVRSLSTKNRNLFQRIYDEIKYLPKVATAGSKEARQLEKVKKLFDEAYRETKNTAQPDGVKYYVRDNKITVESTEQERYEFLKDAKLFVAEVRADAIENVDLASYNTRKKSAVASGFQELAKRLGILNVNLKNSRIEFPFKFSGTNLGKSLHHQLEYGGSYQDYVKAMSCFNEIVENAIPIEVHTEKKTGTKRENSDLKQVYVLVSAYTDGESIIPVELEVKEFKQRENSLYMTVVLTKIDLEVVDTGVPSNASNVPHLFSRSIISLQQPFNNVNPKDARFLKYVPDGFLNEEQKKAKKDAIDKQKREYASYSLSKNDTSKIGDNVYGSDVALESREETVPAEYRPDPNQIAPTAEDIAAMEQERAGQPEDGMAMLYRGLEEISGKASQPDSDESVRAKAEKIVGDRNAVISQRAAELYEESVNLKKGVRASKTLGYIIDHGYGKKSVRTALLNIRDNPDQMVNPNSMAEQMIRKMLNDAYDDDLYDAEQLLSYAPAPESIKTVKDRNQAKLHNYTTELVNNMEKRDAVIADYNEVSLGQALASNSPPDCCIKFFESPASKKADALLGICFFGERQTVIYKHHAVIRR